MRALLRRVASRKIRPKWYSCVRVGGRWQYLHRLVMCTLLDRPLRSNEHVHHIDGDKLNNRPDNLQLLSAGEPMWRTHQRLPFLIECAWCGGLFRPIRAVQKCCCKRCAGFYRHRRRRKRAGLVGRVNAVPDGGVHEPHKSALDAGTVLSSIPLRRD